MTAHTPGDRVAFLIDGGWLVASAKSPGVWHEVTPAGACTCPGFTYRQTCRHVLLLRLMRLLAEPPKEEPAEPDVPF